MKINLTSSKYKWISAVGSTLALSFSINAQSKTFPLSENSWSNPAFVQRFMGSYGVDTGLNPSITSEDKELFQELVPLIQADPNQAINFLRTKITRESNAALDYTMGNLFFQTQKNSYAIQAYKMAITKFPNFLRAYKNLGLLYVQQGDYAEAQKMLIKAIELGGGDGDLYGTLGFCYLNSSKYSNALESYKMAMIFMPESRDWRLGKVQCLTNLGQHIEAIEMLNHLIEETPGDSSLILLQANSMVANQNPMAAAANLQIVKAMGEANAGSLTLLGDIFVNANNVELAFPHYMDALKAEGLDADRAFRVARVLVSRYAWDEAESYLSEVDSKFSSSLSDTQKLELLNYQASVALGKNESAKAAEILNQVVDRDPLNGKALLLLAEYHWNQDEFEKAELYFTRAAKVDDSKVEALIQNARMRVAMKDYSKAAELLEEAQLIQPQSYVQDYLAKVQAVARAAQY
jgi:tetratricopeptide (TPR) repeat protein